MPYHAYGNRSLARGPAQKLSFRQLFEFPSLDAHDEVPCGCHCIGSQNRDPVTESFPIDFERMLLTRTPSPEPPPRFRDRSRYAPGAIDEQAGYLLSTRSRSHHVRRGASRKSRRSFTCAMIH